MTPNDPNSSLSTPQQAPGVSSTSAAAQSPVVMEGDNTGGVIPYKNPQALLAYYIGLFALIPLLGLAMGPAALVLGLRGLKYGRQNPVVKGQAHAWIGIVLGGMWTLVHWIALIFAVVAMLSSRR